MPFSYKQDKLKYVLFYHSKYLRKQKFLFDDGSALD